VIEIVALSEAMREAVGLAERVAPTNANVLVTGESGSGKDALASFIHSRSPRAAQSLVKIDCATLPADLLEAELFGYERGAFTGATERSRDAWRRRIAALWCSMKSRTCRWMPRPSCCA
jgi:transcriptional regulator with PAS, ATPase and Fis domain